MLGLSDQKGMAINGGLTDNMKMVLEITEQMAAKLDDIAKKNLVSREHVAIMAISAFATKTDREHRLFGLSLKDIAQVVIAFGDGLSDLSDQHEEKPFTPER